MIFLKSPVSNNPTLFRWWLGAKQTTSHYLNRWWPSSLTQNASLDLNEFNTLRPRQNGRHFSDDTFKRFFLNVNVWIPIKISRIFVPKGPINNIPALVQIMAWGRPGDKPLSEPMMVCLTTHICVIRPQWVLAMPLNSSFILSLSACQIVADFMGMLAAKRSCSL